MIINCENCNKKFTVEDNLIPSTGRLLQCGSCSHQWKYKPIVNTDLPDEIKIDKTKKIKPSSKSDKTKNKESVSSLKVDKIDVNIEKNVGFLSYLIIFLISSIALIILIDTFKVQISIFIPNIDFYLSSLYESIKDIFLFFKDLLK
tara:strand:- start:74 stop:511 length:438 start_codon:yes stop_codon:yes gene_type:complete